MAATTTNNNFCVYYYFLILLFAFKGTITDCRKIYIDKDGLDKPDCGTKEKPCHTLEQAFELADWNDLILIGDSMPPGICNNEYTINMNLTIRGTREKSFIDCSHSSLSSDSAIFTVEGTNQSEVYFFLENMKIRNLDLTVLFVNSATALVSNCQFINMTNVIILEDTLRFGDATRLVVSECRFVDYRIAVTVGEGNNTSLVIQKCNFDGRHHRKKGRNSALEVRPVRKEIFNGLRISVRQSTFINNQICLSYMKMLAYTVILEMKNCVFKHNFIGLYLFTTTPKLPRNLAKIQNFVFDVRIGHCSFSNLTAKSLIVSSGRKRSANLMKAHFMLNMVVYKTVFLGQFFKSNSGGIYLTLKYITSNVEFTQCSFTFYQMGESNREVVMKNSIGPFTLSKGKVLFQNCSIFDNTSRLFQGTIVADGQLQLRNVKIEGRSPLLNMKGNAVFKNVTVLSQTVSEMFMDVMFFGPGSFIGENFLFRCPVGSIVKQFRTNSFPRGYKKLFYYCEKCPRSSYTLESGSEMLDRMVVNISQPICLKCPYGATCNGHVRASPNYWGFEHNNRLHFKRCPNGYCSGDRNEGLKTCSTGRSGKLCGKCIWSHSENIINTKCTPDTQCNDWWILIVSFILAIAYVFIFLYLPELLKLLVRIIFPTAMLKRRHKLLAIETRSIASKGAQKSLFLLTLSKVILYFYQLQFFVDVRGVPKLDKTKDKMKQIMADAVRFQPSDHLISGCPFIGMTPVTKMLFKSLFNIHIYIVLVFIYMFVFLKANLMKSEISKEFLARLYRGSVVLILLNFAALANTSMTLLQCTDLIDESVLFIDGEVTCYQYWQYLVLAYIVVFIFPVFAVLSVGVQKLRQGHFSARRFVISLVIPAYFFLHLFCYSIRRMIAKKKLQQLNKEVTSFEESDDDITNNCTEISYQIRDNMTSCSSVVNRRRSARMASFCNEQVSSTAMNCSVSNSDDSPCRSSEDICHQCTFCNDSRHRDEIVAFETNCGREVHDEVPCKSIPACISNYEHESSSKGRSKQGSLSNLANYVDTMNDGQCQSDSAFPARDSRNIGSKVNFCLLNKTSISKLAGNIQDNETIHANTAASSNDDPHKVDSENDLGFNCRNDRQEHDSVTSDAVLQVLTKPFQKENDTGPIYWESILLFRRFVIVLFGAMIENLLIRLYAMMAFLACALLHHYIVQPFKYRAVNIVETCSLLLLQVLCAINLYFAHYIMDGEQLNGADQSIADIFNWIVFCIAVAIPFVLILIISLSLVCKALHGLYRITKYCFVKLQSRKWKIEQLQPLIPPDLDTN